MEQASSRGVRASYLLPLREEAATIDGWLELEGDRLRFTDARGLDLRMRLDRLAGVSFGAASEAERRAGAPGVRGGAPPQGSGERRGARDSAGLMRLAGACGPARVRWELLVARDDALALGEAITVALDASGLPCPELDLRAELEAAVPEHGLDSDRDAGIDQPEPEPAPNADHEDDPEAWLHAELEDERSRRVRRRRVIALAIVGTTLLLSAEALIPLLVLRG
jgi:hypothetical protein